MPHVSSSCVNAESRSYPGKYEVGQANVPACCRREALRVAKIPPGVSNTRGSHLSRSNLLARGEASFA